MKTASNIKQFLSLNKEFFFKVKKYSLHQDADDGRNAKRFWLYAESLGEFRLALYIIGVIESILLEKNETAPVFFISFKTHSTLSIAKSLAKKNLALKNNKILYFFHPVFGLKYILKKYVSAVKPDYFISVQHPVSKKLIKELLNINAKLIFSGISISDLKKMGISYTELRTEASGANESIIDSAGPAEEESVGRPPFLSATVSGSYNAMSVKFNTLPLSLKFISCISTNGDGDGNGNAVTGNNIVISFISVHKKESDFILNLIKELISDASLKDFYQSLRFIFVPRNIKNSHRLFKGASKIGLNPAYYGGDIGSGNMRDFLKNGGIKSLIVAGYGVLGDIYPVSDIVYVGKSLFKKEKGGHNILEPALYGKSVITGAYSTNFSDIVREMLKYNAITEVTECNFKGVLTKLIKNEAARNETGKNALDFCLRKKDEFKNYFKSYLTENILYKLI